MKITFLGSGTSQGVPVIACLCEVCQSPDFRDKRLRSSVLIQEANLNIVIDSGPDFRQQMLRSGIRHLDALVYTHSHKDHIAGMDDVRGFNFSQKKAIDIYCNDDTLNALKREFYYVFEEHKYPGVPDVTVNRIEAGTSFSIRDLRILPIQVYHYKMPVLGFRVKDFTYITDANLIPDSQKELIKGSRVLVLNALRQSEHVSHFSLQQAIDLAKELQAERTYFIHMSHQMGLHAEIEQELPEGMFFSYDGLEIEVG